MDVRRNGRSADGTSRGTGIIKHLRSYYSARVGPAQSNLAIIITQPMLAINLKDESYIREFNGRVQPSMIIYLPDCKSERSQKARGIIR